MTPQPDDTSGLGVALGGIGGFASTGAGAFYSWLVYGSWNPWLHPPAMVVIAGLTALAGLSGPSVAAWLTNPPPPTFLPTRGGQP